MKKILTMLMLTIFMVGATPIAEASVGQGLNTPIQSKVISIDNKDKGIKHIKENYEKTKKDVYALKVKVAKCEQTGDCVKLKQDLRLQLKSHVLENIKLLHKHLTKSKMRFEQIEGSEGIVKKIDSYLMELEAHYEKVNQAETKEQLVKSMKGYRVWIKEMKTIVLGFQHKLNLDKIDTFVMRAKTLQYKFSTVIDRLVEEGNPSLNAKQLVNDFSNYIDSAKSKYNKAKSIMDLEGGANEESIELMKDARQDLEKARELLRKIISTLNSQGVSVSQLKSIQPNVAAI